MKITGTVQHEAWARNALPAVEQVRPGLWSVPLPVPVGTVRYVNSYVFESTDGLTLVDPGWDDAPSWEALRAGLDTMGRSVADVRRILATHAHRDHYGQAARVRRESGATIAMHPAEAATLPGRFGSIDRICEGELAWMLRAGAPSDLVPTMLPVSLTSGPVDMPAPDIELDDGASIEAEGWRLRAHWTPGHTPGHLVFSEGRYGLLLTGDHVLPRVSPNISAHPRQSSTPLGEYLASLERVGLMPATEVLPGHEYRFEGLADRAALLREHHEQRLADLLRRVADRPDSAAWDIAAASPWKVPWSQTQPMLRRLALGETLAHLLVLRDRGRIVSQETDGVVIWSLPAA